MKDKLSVNEAAAYLEVTRLRINNLLHRGVLTAEPDLLDSRKKMIPLEQLNKVKQAMDREENIDRPNPEEIAQVLSAIAKSQSEKTPGFQNTRDDIKRMIAEILAKHEINDMQNSENKKEIK